MPTPTHQPWLWDIFCRVIDNHGDLGVTWRLSAQLARLGHRVRLWVDDASALAWMAPEGQPGVQVLPWAASADVTAVTRHAPADVWIEAFGCEIESNFIAENIRQCCAEGQKNIQKPVWINLEYLSAEPYVRRCHTLPSPVYQGPGAGRTKFFFYPGFTAGTGGLLREPGLVQQQQAFDRTRWLAGQGVPWEGERLVSLFCYEPSALPELLALWAAHPRPTRMLVAHGRPHQAVTRALAELGRSSSALDIHTWGALTLQALTPLSQTGYDHLLWACDLNFVRGEDSLVRALWAGKPLVWHIYPQDDGAHGPKLEAFLDTVNAPADLRDFHRRWNDLPSARQAVPEFDEAAAQSWARALHRQTTAATDLCSQLLRFVAEKKSAQP